ncbi:hypothetical protein FHS38_002633 [Streptomyces netropsis]|uniref:Uncharacterized protein n=1 Tax=Streptomyces netropsis TaxID=55404 RepID=A0A7W7LAG3_STRNE|nr:hypothetical protein [Streptomyces netropsis]GGR21339.1 hypothetical protein GCM10010219_27920 [Streptomyces netropsis]
MPDTPESGDERHSLRLIGGYGNSASTFVTENNRSGAQSSLVFKRGTLSAWFSAFP